MICDLYHVLRSTAGVPKSTGWATWLQLLSNTRERFCNVPFSKGEELVIVLRWLIYQCQESMGSEQDISHLVFIWMGRRFKVIRICIWLMETHTHRVHCPTHMRSPTYKHSHADVSKCNGVCLCLLWECGWAGLLPHLAACGIDFFMVSKWGGNTPSCNLRNPPSGMSFV